MPTPASFRGIFYDPDRGSDLLFDIPDIFVRDVKDESDGLFLTIGAHVDMLVNGHPGLAQKFLDLAKDTWPTADWDIVEQTLARVKQLFQTKPEDWRHQIYETVASKVLSARFHPPANWHSRFFTPEQVKAIFNFRDRIASECSRLNPDKYGFLLKVLIDCDANGAKDFAQEIERGIRQYYPHADWGTINRIRQNPESIVIQS